MNENEFYVGYMPTAPPALGRFLRFIIAGLFLLVLLVSVLLVVSQRPFAPAVFEFGVVKDFEGVLLEKPYPLLLVKRPGQTTGAPAHSQYYLVSPGKFGAAGDVKGLHGSKVKLQGSLIYQDSQLMIEIIPESVKALGKSRLVPPVLSANAAGGQSLGKFKLKGEIIDSKCFLGVMNPGRFKLHKTCATLCIRGGIPPILLTRNKDNKYQYFLLVGPDGKNLNQEVLPFVADPVEITGELVRNENVLVLKADPANITRINK